MNDTEQLIKEALGKLAERTPHPGPTLNALRRKRKKHRNVFLIAAAGIAAVAVLIFAGTIASDRYQPPNAGDAAAALMADKGKGVAIKYTPHWLPDGFVETFRGVDATSQVRTWSLPGGEGHPYNSGEPMLTLATSPDLPDTGGWEQTSVRGLKAWWRLKEGQSPGSTAEVVWKAQEVLIVTLRGVNEVKQAALRAADSVRADSKAVHKAPFTVDDKHAQTLYGTSPTAWTAENQDQGFRIWVSPREPDLSGMTTPVTVRGKQGFSGNGRVLVKDGDLWVMAGSSASSVPVEELVKAAEKVQLVPSPDTSWIGGSAA